jgi:aryl-alcohol dehydrogenase-like predicted oxidoreductase
VIDRALALGVDVFDTADLYGRGSMERRLGERLPRETTYVVTDNRQQRTSREKAGGMKSSSATPSWAGASSAGSRRRSGA